MKKKSKCTWYSQSGVNIIAQILLQNAGVHCCTVQYAIDILPCKSEITCTDLHIQHNSHLPAQPSGKTSQHTEAPMRNTYKVYNLAKNTAVQVLCKIMNVYI